MPDEPMARLLQTAQTGPLRVAVIAESPQVRASLQALAESSPAIAFAGGAADAAALADRLAGAAIDVLVIDLEPSASDSPAPPFDAGFAPSAFVLLTDEPDLDWVLDVLPGDAVAILPRNAPQAEIVASIEATAAGLCVLARDVFGRLLGARKPLRQSASDAPFEALTSREIEVLAMLAEGLGNKEIARQLDISDNTVKFHLSSIFGKLGATNRTEAVMLGMRRGFVMV
jgi:DNA-binding NarL/FixJ family response regulator